MVKYNEHVLQSQITPEIKEILREQGEDPEVRPQPAQKFLREHDISGIESFAQRRGMTVTEVLEEVCGFSPPAPKPLGIKHQRTRRAVNDWLDEEEKLYNKWGDNRINQARTHFRALANVSVETLGTTNLLRIIDGEKETAVSELKEVIGGLASEIESSGALSNYTRSLERWANNMEMEDEIENEIVSEVRDKFNFTYERSSPEHELTVEQLRELWDAAESLKYKVVLILLTTSGLRRKEPTDIKIEDLRLDREDAYIVFDSDRKTSAATVPIMAGLEIIEEWIEYIQTLDYTSGVWLFPSKLSQDGSRPPGWINNRFDELVNKANVSFPDGNKPTPKDLRAFWYKRFTDAQLAWLSHLDQIAEIQGVSSSRIINDHYISDQKQRDHFLLFARECFVEVFGEERLHDHDAVMEAREHPSHSPQSIIDDFIESDTETDATETRTKEADGRSDKDDNTDHGGWTSSQSVATPVGVAVYPTAHLGETAHKQAKKEYEAMWHDQTAPNPTVEHIATSLGLALAVGILLGVVATPESLPTYLLGGVIGGIKSVWETDIEHPDGTNHQT